MTFSPQEKYLLQPTKPALLLLQLISQALTTGCVMLDSSDGFKLGLKTAATASADDFAKDEGVGEHRYLYP